MVSHYWRKWPCISFTTLFVRKQDVAQRQYPLLGTQLDGYTSHAQNTYLCVSQHIGTRMVLNPLFPITAHKSELVPKVTMYVSALDITHDVWEYTR